jgi:hypothetical protein
MKDFFISYNEADRAWAEWIGWLLEDAGYSVLIQAWDFRPGENFVLEMQQATTVSNKTIVILSNSYLNASYTHAEWAAAFAHDPQGQRQKLIPIRVAPCEPTGLLASVICVDIVGSSEQDARLAILGAFSARAKPSRPPAFPGDDATESHHVPYPGEVGESTKTKIRDSIIAMGDNDRVLTATIQPHLTSVTNATISSHERLELARNLNGIPPQQFNMIVFALNPPAGLIPPMPAPQGDRVTALLEWAKGPGGCNLAEVQQILAELLKPDSGLQRETKSVPTELDGPSETAEVGAETEQSHPEKTAESVIELDEDDSTDKDENSGLRTKNQETGRSSSELYTGTLPLPKHASRIRRMLASGIKRLRIFVRKKLRKRNPLLRKLSFPRRLTTWKMERVKLVFEKHLKYAKVEFNITHPDIEVWYNNLPVKNPIFKFNFPADDFTQIFYLRLKKLKSNVGQPVSLICSDLKSEVLPHEVRLIKLRCRTGLPTSLSGVLNYIPWAIEQFIYAAWYVKYPIIAALVLVCYIVIPVLFPDKVRNATHKMENILIAAQVWPDRKDKFDDNFNLTEDGKWEKETEWEYPVGKWKAVAEPTPPKNESGQEEEQQAGESIKKEGALHISGSGLGIYKGPNVDGERDRDAFYDFELEFIAVLPADGQPVTWLVRADKDAQQWYEFELLKNSNRFQLKGYSYSGGERTPLKGSADPFDLPECCRAGDQIKVRGIIKDYEFTHWIALENPYEPDPPRQTLGVKNPVDGRVFKAERKWFRWRYRYGSFGLRGTSDKDDAQIIYWHIRPLAQ